MPQRVQFSHAGLVHLCVTRGARRRFTLGAFLLIVAGACNNGSADTPTVPVTIPSPSADGVWVVTNGEAQIAPVGELFQLALADSKLRFADPAGGGLAIEIMMTPSAGGLSVSGRSIVGVPPSSAVTIVTVAATDIHGRTARSSFPIVAMRNDLPAPMMPAQPYGYSDAAIPLPSAIANSPQVVRIDNMLSSANPVTDAGAALGRVLFYDRRLSSNDAVSCASCHQQQFSFSDTARLSVGVRGTTTRRHSMALTNVRFYGPSRFFHDERGATLEALALQPVFDAVEMGLHPDAVVPKLGAAPFYAPLYAAAFGDSNITLDRTARALSQFVRSLRTTGGKIDSLLANTVTFTDQEFRGLVLFEAAGCKGCHESYAVVGDAARNNGLDAHTVDEGAGQGRMKPPSLRNVVQRPPYMHDGRFRTLEEVIDFYDHGVQNNPDLDQRLRDQNGLPKRLHLTVDQKTALMAFLNTFTDRTFLRDPRFSDPFPR